jgi:hypothetical protein
MGLPRKPELLPMPSSPASSVPELPLSVSGANPGLPPAPQLALHTMVIKAIASAALANDGRLNLARDAMRQPFVEAHLHWAMVTSRLRIVSSASAVSARAPNRLA